MSGLPNQSSCPHCGNDMRQWPDPVAAARELLKSMPEGLRPLVMQLVREIESRKTDMPLNKFRDKMSEAASALDARYSKEAAEVVDPEPVRTFDKSGLYHPANQGHGHVFPRPDGVVARCGGPGLCRNCSHDRVLRDSMLADADVQPARGILR